MYMYITYMYIYHYMRFQHVSTEAKSSKLKIDVRWNRMELRLEDLHSATAKSKEAILVNA